MGNGCEDVEAGGERGGLKKGHSAQFRRRFQFRHEHGDPRLTDGKPDRPDGGVLRSRSCQTRVKGVTSSVVASLGVLPDAPFLAGQSQDPLEAEVGRIDGLEVKHWAEARDNGAAGRA